MSTEKLIAGAQSTFTSLMTTELNSLASGNAIMGSTAIDNRTNLDLTAEFSFTTGGSITPTGTPYVSLYIFPLNGDGTTYGDGRFASSAAGPPTSGYYRGFAGIVAAGQVQTGYFAIPGTSIFQLPLPRALWKPVFFNFSGVSLSASGNILYYQTTNRQIT